MQIKRGSAHIYVAENLLRLGLLLQQGPKDSGLLRVKGF